MNISDDIDTITIKLNKTNHIPLNFANGLKLGLGIGLGIVTGIGLGIFITKNIFETDCLLLHKSLK